MADVWTTSDTPRTIRFLAVRVRALLEGRRPYPRLTTATRGSILALRRGFCSGAIVPPQMHSRNGPATSRLCRFRLSTDRHRHCLTQAHLRLALIDTARTEDRIRRVPRSSPFDCSYCDRLATRFSKVDSAAKKRFAGHKKELRAVNSGETGRARRGEPQRARGPSYL
jgi:hypothetical protein